jgi:hypothetical protein
VSHGQFGKGPEGMTNRSCVLSLLLFGLAALLGMTGCAYTTKAGSGASATTTPIISVTITQGPPASLLVGSTVHLSATVSNDPADAGVDWVASCGSAPFCGSFSPAHTASGGTTIFTAPPEVPTKSTIAITALSTTNHGEQFAAYVNIFSGVTAVIITQAPPATVPAGVTITVGATVIGDPANLGVDWKATCGTTGVLRQPVDCTPPAFHSVAGGTTTFTVPPPQQIPNIVGSTVTLTAFATADHGFSASVLFQVTVPPTIQLTQAPPSTMLAGATAPVAAVVANDTTNSGVTWSVSCGEASCGSFSQTQSASGQAITFTAPANVPPPSIVVTITAYSTAGGFLVNATVNVTIVAPLSVQITQGVPTGSIVQGASAPLIATVTNDPSNQGVDWTVSCGSPGACGTFVPTHTASGAATTFTAPSAVPSGNTVTITATSTAQPSQTSTEKVTVTAGVPPNSLLEGQFVILLTAKNSSNGPYALGGVITGDGTGHITKGNVDLVDASGNASPATSVPVMPTSTYSIGPDGRGQIQLLINTIALNGGFGVNGSGAFTLSVVFVTPQHALLSETDSFGSATGTLDRQNTNDLASFEAGSWNNATYSLTLSGVEWSAPNPDYFVASAVTVDLPGNSYSYITDQSDRGVITSAPFATVSHGLSATRALNGELIFSPVNLGLRTQFNLDAWLIDASHFVITDWRDSFTGSPDVIVAGYMTAQPSSPSVSGTYAFTEAGATPAAQPQAAGGILTCGSSGILDVTPLGGAALDNQPISTACAAPVNGRGLIAISGATAAGISQFAAYPTTDQGLYLIELDGGSTGTSGSSGAGVALQQTISGPVASDFSGKYASNFRASTAPGTQNFAGQIISDGVSVLSGTADVNDFSTTAAPPAGTPSLNATLTGSFTAATDGRFPLTLAITHATGQPAPEFTTLDSACYIVDTSRCLLLGLDTTAPGTGVLLLQNTGL